MKYFRTYHLPWSEEVSKDDKRLKFVDHLIGFDLIISEKMDGSNVCLSADGVASRGGNATHPSFNLLKSIWAKKHIDNGVALYGEWLYAKHSISYTNLPHYLMLFGGFYEDRWAAWEDVVLWAELLEIPTVPVLFRGKVSSTKELEELTLKLSKTPSDYTTQREGVVVRVAEAFTDPSVSIAKWVRKGHVQTSSHWKFEKITKNQLSENAKF